MMSGRRIALVGPMGVGKSTIGHCLAEKLGCQLIDLDMEIEHRSATSIEQIFTATNEAGFRRLEADVLHQVTLESNGHDCILATGGGIVTTVACREILTNNWETVWLTGSVKTIVAHLEQSTTVRPLLQGAVDLAGRISRLMAERAPLYESVARWRISVDGTDADTLAEKLCELGGWTNCNG